MTKSQCNTCKGKGQVLGACAMCDGTGKSSTGNKCQGCANGKTYHFCSTCDGSGEVEGDGTHWTGEMES
jgi:RecJ-like exonuclease